MTRRTSGSCFEARPSRTRSTATSSSCRRRLVRPRRTAPRYRGINAIPSAGPPSQGHTIESAGGNDERPLSGGTASGTPVAGPPRIGGKACGTPWYRKFSRRSPSTVRVRAWASFASSRRLTASCAWETLVRTHCARNSYWRPGTSASCSAIGTSPGRSVGCRRKGYVKGGGSPCTGWIAGGCRRGHHTPSEPNPFAIRESRRGWTMRSIGAGDGRGGIRPVRAVTIGRAIAPLRPDT